MKSIPVLQRLALSMILAFPLMGPTVQPAAAHADSCQATCWNGTSCSVSGPGPCHCYCRGFLGLGGAYCTCLGAQLFMMPER